MMPQREKSAQQSASNTDAFAVLGLLLLAIVPYLNSLSGAFVYDDRLQIVGNPYVHSFRYLGKIFGSTVWTFEGAQGVTNYFRPMMTFAYLVCYKLFGPIPFGFHLLNLTLHAAVVLLLFAVTERLFGDRLLALIAAGLFALHPIHTESVAWIAALPDLQLSVFFLLTFLFYLRLAPPDLEYAREANGPLPSTASARWTFVAMFASYIFALLSKEQALVLPLIATIYEHFYRPDGTDRAARADRAATSLRTKLQRYAGLWIIALGYIAFRHFVLGGFAPSVSRPTLSWYRVVLTAITLIGTYLWKLIWPLHLSAFYVFHESQHLSDAGVLLGLLGLLGCLNLFVWLWSRARPISFAFIWMGATLAPVLNARWLPAAVFAERYLYLPSIGFCWLAGCLAVVVWRASPTEFPAPGSPALPGAARARSRARIPFLRRAVPAALAVVALLYGVRTIRRNRVWRTEEVLFRATLAEEPDAQLIRTNLGVLYWDSGNDAGAEREWLASLGPHAPYAPTLNNLGLLRARQKRYAEAIAFFEQAMTVRPSYMDPYKNRASTYADMGRFDDADRGFRQAVTLAPLSSDAHNSYGHFLLDRGRTDEALEQFTLSDENDPNAEAEENLGDIFAGKGDAQHARAAFEAALAFNSIDNHARFGLAALDEQENRYADAMREYRTGLETDPMNETALAAVRRLKAQGTR
jgi:tetratricopeptide (TPR) repeat protein